MAHDVFISYATADQTVAQMVCATLEKQGIRCWMAPRDLLPGRTWAAAIIDAIESDPVSFEEAARNVGLSPWSGRIRLYNADARHFHFPSPYDHIISNPPFYESDLQSPDKRINDARHGNSLTLEDLIGIVRKNLAGRGRFSVLLPYHRFRYFEKLAEDHGFFLQEALALQQTASHQPFRFIGLFGKEKTDLIRDDLILADAAGKNSAALLEMMKSYYLYS